MSILISPDALEIDAVVPQCLDNQFVSNSTFSLMLKKGWNYDKPEIKKIREQEFKSEFIRSLIYSSQVIIQRMGFWSSDFLYTNFQASNPKNSEAFATLIGNGVIVPYLFKESSFSEPPDLETHQAGKVAMNHLFSLLDKNLKCVRLAVDENLNQELTQELANVFSRKVTSFRYFQAPEMSGLGREIFEDSTILDDPKRWPRFRKSIKQFSNHWDNELIDRVDTENPYLSRAEIYSTHFMREKNSVANGNFKQPTQDEFIFEKKKLVDLVYNTNLPDALGRYTFTPQGLPSRLALQDAPNKVKKDSKQIFDSVNDKELLDYLKKQLSANIQKPMALPILKDLEIHDVVEIRTLPEWAHFIHAQQDLLSNPLSALHNFATFHNAFATFQTALSNWYISKDYAHNLEAKYSNYATLAISVAGQLIFLNAGAPSVWQNTGMILSSAGAQLLPKRINKYAVKLMACVLDTEKKAIDQSRSYSIELMEAAGDFSREDIEDLINSIQKKPEHGFIMNGLGIADQGID